MNTKLHRGRPLKHDWHLVDWSQPTTWIADQMGLRLASVSFARRKYAPETIKKHYSATVARNERWENIDWLKNNSQIGRELKMDRNTVAKARKKYSQIT